MKTFLRTVLAFCLLPLAWCIVLTVVNLRIQRAEPLPVKARTLALGDSRIGCGIDPRALKGSDNLALPAEPYLLSYCKLRHITAQHRIDTLVIGFAPHVLSVKDHRKFRDNGWATERLIKRMYPLVSVPEGFALGLHPQTYARMLFMRYCAWPQETHLTWVGKFSGLKRAFKDDSQEAFQRQYLEEDGTVAPMSEESIVWLDSILALCQRERIATYLVAVPVHDAYYRGIPPGFLERFEELGARYAAQGIPVIDRLHYYHGDSLFANSDHLNGQGARRFTRELSAIMRPAPEAAKYDSTGAH